MQFYHEFCQELKINIVRLTHLDQGGRKTQCNAAEEAGAFFKKKIFIWLCQVLVAKRRVFNFHCGTRDLLVVGCQI